MTKPKTTISAAQAAIKAFNEQAASIRAEQAKTAAEIAAHKAEIKRLEDMPVSRADFGLMLKEHIAAQAEAAEDRLISALKSVKHGFGQDAPIENQSYDKKGMAEFEIKTIGSKDYGTDRLKWILSEQTAAYGSFLTDSFFKSKENSTLSVLCYFFPDTVHDRIMQTVNSRCTEWHNDTLPTVSERRETIINLKEEIKHLEARLAELDVAIAEFNGLTAPQHDELTDEQRMILVNLQ